MNPIRLRVILGVCMALAGASARPDEPASPPATVADPAGSPPSMHPDCPICRQAARLKEANADAPRDPDVRRSSSDPDQSPRDPEVVPAQVPPRSEPLTPTSPEPPALPEPPAMPPPPPAPSDAPWPRPRARFFPPVPEPRTPAGPPAEAVPAPPPVAVAATATSQGASAQDMVWPSEIGPDPVGFGPHDVPVMIGDQAPASLLQALASGAPPIPHAAAVGRPPLPPDPATRAPAVVPWARGFKIAENQSPQPQDRIFTAFNYFNDLDGRANRALGSSVGTMQGYRYLFGVEKTFLAGNASLGLRLPLNVLSATSAVPALGGTSTAVGNMTIFGKYVLWTEPFTRSLVSTGLAITVPNGPSSFAGAPGVRGFHDAQVQPFVGYIFRQGDWYLQGFSSIDAATSSRDVTMWYNDIGLGYFLYRADDPEAFLSALVPTFEVHVNDPLNHRGALRLDDPAGTADVVDLTFGASFVVRRSGVLSVAFIDPVTGPRPFAGELAVLFNLYFGGGNRLAQVAAAPPPAR